MSAATGTAAGAAAAGTVAAAAEVQGAAETVSLTINGKPCTAAKGEVLLEVAKRHGVFIPTLCYHEGLPGLGACRLCICEVTQRGRTKTVVSCMYPVEDGIEVETMSPAVREMRGVIVTLLHRLAPNSDKIAQLAKGIGADLPRLADKEGGDTCILCGRCTSACELLGSGAIAKASRGVEKEIATPYHQPSEECIGCGSCAHVCPTDSIATEAGADSFTIWGREFRLLRCASCGQPFATEEQYEFVRAREDARYGLGDQPLCDACAKREVAAKLAHSDVHYGAARP